MANSGKFVKMGKITARLCISKCKVENDINRGVFPQPLFMGGRAKFWLGTELDRYEQAIIRGEDLKAVVAEIHAARQSGEAK